MRMGIGLGVGINRSNYAQGIFNAYSARVVADGGVVESGTCVDAVSSLLQSASLLLIPSGYKGGKLYAEIPTNGNGDLTWTRGSDAFRTNASGLIQRVPWNLITYSEEFNNGAWSKVNATITANTTTAPNGTLTADSLNDNSTNSIHVCGNAGGGVGSFTFSFYAKSNSLTRVGLLTAASVNTTLASTAQVFDLLSGTVVNTISGVTATITNVGNGWFLCSTTLTALASGDYYITCIKTGTSIAYIGDGSSVFIWGAQLVQGTTAQTYLPTTDRLNFPRLSYMYGSCPSALLEPQRTNILTWSEDATQWLKSPIIVPTVTANQITSPDGTTNADKVDFPSVSGVGAYSLLFTSFTASAGSYSGSIYLRGSVGGEVVWIAFTKDGINYTQKICTLTTSWQRFNLTSTLTSGTDYFQIGVDLRDTAQSSKPAQTIYVWGRQLEQGAFQTTYIPTTSATATRVADSFSRNNIYTNGLITASGGTWFVELRNNVAYVRDSSSGFGIGDSSSLATNSIFLRLDQLTSARLAIIKRLAGIPYPLYYTTTDTVKIAIKWNGTSADIFVNGVKEISATTFTTTNMDFLAVGSALGVGVPIFIQQMALFNSPLTDAQCQTLTT